MTSAFDIIPQVSFTLRHQTLQCPLRCAAHCIAHCTALLPAPYREAPHFRLLPPAAGKESKKKKMQRPDCCCPLTSMTAILLPLRPLSRSR